MRAAFYCRIGGQGYGFLLPEEADKLREFFAEHQDKPALEKPSSASKIFCRELDIRVTQIMEANIGQFCLLQNALHGMIGTVGRNGIFRSKRIPEDPLTVRLLFSFPQELRRSSRKQDLSFSCTGFCFACAQLSVFVSMQSSPHIKRSCFHIEI